MAWSIVRVSKGSGPHGGPSSNLVLGTVRNKALPVVRDN